MSITAMKQALEALEEACELIGSAWVWRDEKGRPAINAIKEALAQPEQEPKCGAIIEVFGKDWRLEYMSLPVGKHKLYTQQYTYTTPQPQEFVCSTGLCHYKREWVGLTDAEIEEFDYYARDLVMDIEKALKERNNVA